MEWLLLIYSVPSQPARARAYVWRELKKLGGVYLRDGVCALPDQASVRASLRLVANRVATEYGGSATVADAHLEPAVAESVVRQSRAARVTEYADISHELQQFQAHVARESRHRMVDRLELQELRDDLRKLRRWFDQVRARDYFDADGSDAVAALLMRSNEELDDLEVAA
jgi:hypothetical protein